MTKVPESTLRELTWMPSVATSAQISMMANELMILRNRVFSLESALTPSAETKAAYMGEFYVTEEIDGENQVLVRHWDIPWITIKEILASIRSHAKGGNEP